MSSRLDRTRGNRGRVYCARGQRELQLLRCDREELHRYERRATMQSMLHPECTEVCVQMQHGHRDYATVHARCRDQVSESQVLGLRVADFKTVIRHTERHHERHKEYGSLHAEEPPDPLHVAHSERAEGAACDHKHCIPNMHCVS